MQNSFQTTSQRNSTLAIIQDQGQQSQNLLFQFSVKKNKNGKKKKKQTVAMLSIKFLLLYLIEMQGKKCEVFRHLHLLWILFDDHPFLVQATTSTVTLLYTFFFKRSVSEMLIWLRNWLYLVNTLPANHPAYCHI